jgi:hypothetical protein
MRTRASWPLLAALLFAAGCMTQTKLQPLPAARTTQGGAALAEVEGVRLVADGAAWKGSPSDLENIVTPVEVRLENQSGRPLRIEYDHFVLEGSSRFQYAALSPFELREEGLAMGGSGDEAGNVALSMGMGMGVGGPWPAWRSGPFVGGYAWGPLGRGWYDPFYDPWYDPFFGGPYARGNWRPPEPLPTRDMVRRALPEGTLQPGDSVAGFLYFQDVSEREGSVTLQVRLVDARTGEQFGTLSIPFGVRS